MMSHEEPAEDQNDLVEPLGSGRRRWWRWPLVVVVLAVVLVGSFELVYAGKVYSGVSANGLNLGGMSRAAAKAKLTEHITQFAGQTLAINYGERVMRIPVNDLATTYDVDRALALAYNYGRQGDWRRRAVEQARALLGRPTAFAAFTYDDERLLPYVADIDDDITTPVADAGLAFGDAHAQVTPSEAGGRLNLGRLVWLVADRLAQTSTDDITAPVYQLRPMVTTAALQQAAAQADRYLAGPLTLSYGDNVKEITPAQIVPWIQVGRPSAGQFMATRRLTDLYPQASAVTLKLDSKAIAAYVADLAAKVDIAPRNAALTMTNGSLAVDQASQVGASLNQQQAITAITEGLTKPASQRNLKLELTTVQPEVSETSLPSLGIKELVSEGVSMFPGSTSARTTNVQVGAAKFNGVVLKPGQVFSFGALLGDVGPAQGYKPELVILADHEEKQYGGGLCQVSSTAFRAALNAGLPIVERRNHSFAISYYTQPYGVPGVDATIYYPQLDFKFKNDTGAYLLIQTKMVGTNLTFSFYGTKAKTGAIRGPQFISGTMDHTKPSHTVFYRDVLDLAGKVIKTDTFHSYYQSSKDFPVQNQFNN